MSRHLPIAACAVAASLVLATPGISFDLGGRPGSNGPLIAPALADSECSIGPRHGCAANHVLLSKMVPVPALAPASSSPPPLMGADLRSRSSLLHFASAPRLPRLWGAGPPGRVAIGDLACALIKQESTARSLPAFFLAKLIWKESAFNPGAVSPKGAKGIAQFMPSTAFERGLADPFDIKQAIPHSAAYLRDLHNQFGSLGLAAAAYNAGPRRVAD
jgi:hypothetical protein